MYSETVYSLCHFKAWQVVLNLFFDSFYIPYCPVQVPIPEQGPTPNFDSSVVCEVLCVTGHHAKFLRGDSKLHSLSSRRLFRWVSGATTSGSKVCKQYKNCSTVACSTKFAYCKQWLNTAKPWQRDFGLVCFLAGYIFLYCHTGLVCLRKEAQAKVWHESLQ